MKQQVKQKLSISVRHFKEKKMKKKTEKKPIINLVKENEANLFVVPMFDGVSRLITKDTKKVLKSQVGFNRSTSKVLCDLTETKFPFGMVGQANFENLLSEVDDDMKKLLKGFTLRY